MSSTSSSEGPVSLRSLWTVQLACVCAFSAIGSFSFGFDNGWWSGVLGETAFNNAYGSIKSVSATGAVSHSLSATEQSNGTALGTAGIMVGCMIAPFLNSRWGRKSSFYAVGFVGLIGALIEALSTLHHSYYTLVAGKIIINASVGIASATVGAYQSECAPKELRGALVTFYTFLQNIGGLVAGGVIWAVNTRTDAGGWLIPICLQFFPSIIALVGTPFLPESPRWLVEQGRMEEAEAVIRRLRGPNSRVDASAECAEIRAAFEDEKRLHAGASFVELFRGANLRRTGVATGLQCLQQGQGISFMANYLLITFISLGFQDVYKLLFILYVCLLAFSGLGFYLPDKVGRRPLLIGGATTMLCCQVVVAAVVSHTATPTGSMANLIIAASFIWFFVFAFTWSGIPWLTTAEIPSSTLRSLTLSLGAWSGFGVGLISNFVTPYIQNPQYGNLGAKIGWLWAGFSFVSIFYVYFLVPELKGRSLEEIDQLYEAGISVRQFKTYDLNKLRNGEVAYNPSSTLKRSNKGDAEHIEEKV